MIPRHPLIFKIATICATILFACFVLFSRQSKVIITRNVIYITEEPTPTLMLENDGLQSFDDQDQEQSEVYGSTTTTTELPATTNYQLFVNSTGLKYNLDHDACDDSVYLMIYVHTGPENTERRRVIRKTWASNDILKKHGARLVFVMGQVTNEDVQAALENENEVYKDIIQSNFSDTYRNLTYKAISGLKWVSDKCPKAIYVLKTDDDIVVDIHRIVRLLKGYIEKKWGKEKILGCYVWKHMNVDRNKTSKWYTSPEEYPKDFFLQYCSGSAYIMSTDVVKKLYRKARTTPFFWVDDYYVTGMLAHNANVTLTSLNDRYILENNADIPGLLKNDTKTRFVFVHSPNTSISQHVWQNYLDRW